nr:hypothetical protein [Tanacetum cinerariifolium]
MNRTQNKEEFHKGDQVDLSRFAALHSELQETKELVQARHEGGGDQGSLLPRSMRLDVPKFYAADPKSWVFAINEYFALLATPDEQRIKVVGFNLEGDAAEWFRWMTHNKLVASWDGFLDSVRNHFGPSKYEDPQGGLDVVLGIQWLQKLGKGDESLRVKKISLRHMQALLESEEVYGVYEFHSLPIEADGPAATAVTTELEHPELNQLLALFGSLFQVPTGLPPHRVIDHRIHLLPNTKPVNVRPYRYPHYKKGEMDKLVTEMLNHGIIRYSQSPFSLPVLLVKKKDGSCHFYVDYRELNEVTIKDKFPIHTADEMFDELGGAVIFTKLKLRAGYHQIRVHERDIYKTAFRTHDGHYEFLVMPFGITNAPSTFQAAMHRLFLAYLRKFEHQFYVKRSKCVFGAATLEYLGHVISSRGVEMDPKKITAVMEWSVPETQRQDDFKWGEREALTFMTLKTRLSTVPLLSLPDFDQQFIIEADASDDGRVTIPAFMTLSQPMLGFLDDLRKENESFEELKSLHQQLDRGDGPLGFRQNEVLDSSSCGYLQPLPTPTAVWEDVSMDFITGLPTFKGFTVILVVVDRFTNSIKMSPFQALYGRMPLTVVPFPPGASKVAAVEDLLVERDELLRQLKSNLLAAKERMELKANKRRRFRHYGPYEVVERIGKVAYRLALPTTKWESNSTDLVQWDNGSPEEATWECLSDFQNAYPDYNLGDKVAFEERGSVTPAVQRSVRVSRRKRNAPSW